MDIFTPLLGLSANSHSHLSYVFGNFVSLFVMVDPFAAVPVYLLLTERFTKTDVKKTRRKAVFVASGILVAFSILGVGILNFFGITIAALRVAGGLLLLRFALEHVNSTEKIKHEEEEESLHREDISVVPLAVPLLAGPGAISSIVVQSTNAGQLLNKFLLIIVIVLVMWISYLTLKSSQYLYRVLGKTGLNLLGKIMGILVAGIAIQYILTGLKDVFPNL